MTLYVKAFLLLGTLGMAVQTFLWRQNEELGVLYLILFTAFRELWEANNECARNNGVGRQNICTVGQTARACAPKIIHTKEDRRAKRRNTEKNRRTK